MVSKITSVSLNQDDLDTIDKYKLSPTALIKEKLRMIEEFQRTSGFIVKELERKVKIWSQIAEDYKKFLIEKNLINEFLERS